jgi:hypothetical protein
LKFDRFRATAPYLYLLALQTVAASFLFWIIFPVFLQMMSHLGEPQELTMRSQGEVVAGAAALQGFYWLRYRSIGVNAPFENVVVGHLLGFASRVSFFFGGALFSTIFFRHLPELSAYPAVGQSFVKGLIVMEALFALYCYSLELERFGKAIEGNAALNR